MDKTKDSIKALLRQDYEKAVNGYLCELLRMWELDAHYGYWIAVTTLAVSMIMAMARLTSISRTSSIVCFMTSPANSTRNGRTIFAMLRSLISPCQTSAHGCTAVRAPRRRPSRSCANSKPTSIKRWRKRRKE